MDYAASSSEGSERSEGAQFDHEQRAHSSFLAARGKRYQAAFNQIRSDLAGKLSRDA